MDNVSASSPGWGYDGNLRLHVNDGYSHGDLIQHVKPSFKLFNLKLLADDTLPSHDICQIIS